MPVLAILLIWTLLFQGCRPDPYRTDISGVDLDLKIARFEMDLFGLDFDSIPQAVPVLQERYGDFFEIFNYRIINIGGPGQVTYPEYLKKFPHGLPEQ